MVPLSDLLAAQVEARLNKAETQAKEKELALLQRQMSQAQEQVDAARLDAAKLQAEMRCMVQRSELEDAKAQVKTLETEQQMYSQQHHAAVSNMQARITVLKHEQSATLSAMQV